MYVKYWLVLDVEITILTLHRRMDLERMASGLEKKDYGVVKLDVEAIS